MNRIFLILTIFFLINCKTSKNTVIISQISTKNQVVLRLSKKHKKVISVKFPKEINLENKSSKNRSFIKINYDYNSIPIERNYGITLFMYDDNSLTEVSNNSKKELPPHSSKKYLIYTIHFVDSIKNTQNQFKPYVTKMLAQNKDTLHIGTINDFNKKHKDLFEKLTKNDSISVQFLDNGKLGERITVPVQW